MSTPPASDVAALGPPPLAHAPPRPPPAPPPPAIAAPSEVGTELTDMEALFVCWLTEAPPIVAAAVDGLAADAPEEDEVPAAAAAAVPLASWSTSALLRVAAEVASL